MRTRFLIVAAAVASSLAVPAAASELFGGLYVHDVDTFVTRSGIEGGVDARLGPRTTLEASWVHLSHAQLFGRQNPGMDNFGLRLSVELP
jgi:hypothetical protein